MQPVMLVVSVPSEHADALRTALSAAGAGRMGKYSNCSFSYSGTGRFVPEAGSHPTYGKLGELSNVSEERIEVICNRDDMPKIVAALKEAHPYEEPAFHWFPVEIGI